MSKKKTFSFRKIDTGGILIVEATSEKAAIKKRNLDPAIWEPIKTPEETEAPASG